MSEMLAPETVVKSNRGRKPSEGPSEAKFTAWLKANPLDTAPDVYPYWVTYTPAALVDGKAIMPSARTDAFFEVADGGKTVELVQYVKKTGLKMTREVLRVLTTSELI